MSRSDELPVVAQSTTCPPILLHSLHSPGRDSVYLSRRANRPQSLVERLAANRWRGQIIGPHGSGKSTLLATLIPALTAAGRQRSARSRCIRASIGCRGWSDRRFAADTQLVIDGYEQLSWWSRRRVKSLCQRHGAGLLVTAHSDMGLPTIFQTQPSQELAQTIVEKIVPADSTRLTS